MFGTGDVDRLTAVEEELLNLFDVDGNGVVDFTELTSGVSVLCGGDRDEKAAAAFALYDYNGDPVINLDEMTHYLTAVFKVVYQAEPGTEEQMGCSSEELAEATAEHAFEEADLNQDGNLTLEEFQLWYKSDPGQVISAASTSMATLRRLTNFKVFSVHEIFKLSSRVTGDKGKIDHNDFNTVVVHVATDESRRETPLSDSEQDELVALLGDFFFLFDADGNGSVDFTELSRGMSVLCGGDLDEKAQAAFALHDYNGDGVINIEEMTCYLTAVYKVVYHAEPGKRRRWAAARRSWHRRRHWRWRRSKRRTLTMTAT